jgi:hypothetical protein
MTRRDPDLVDPSIAAHEEPRRRPGSKHEDTGFGQEVGIAGEPIDPLGSRPARETGSIPEGRVVDLEAHVGGRRAPLEDGRQRRPWRRPVRVLEIALHGELLKDEVETGGRPPLSFGIRQALADQRTGAVPALATWASIHASCAAQRCSYPGRSNDATVTPGSSDHGPRTETQAAGAPLGSTSSLRTAPTPK